METKEIWKNSKTFDGVIQVSNLGNFRKKVIAINSKGFEFVYSEREIFNNCKKNEKRIVFQGKGAYAKRLVAEVFVKGFDEKKAVTFKDGNKDNFHPKNLKLREFKKLEDSNILEIIELYKQKVNYKVIAEKYGIHPINIYRIARNEIWKHVKREPIIRNPRKSK